MKLQSKAMPSSEGFKQNTKAHLSALAEISEAAEAAAIIKVGRHLPKVRRVLERLGLSDRAHYIEHATMAQERRMALDAVDPAAVPYFSMVLVHVRGEAWR